MLLTKSRISLVSIGLILLIGFILFLATNRAGADVGDHQHWAGTLDPGLVVWNWDTSGTTVKVDFNIDASLDGQIVEIEIFVEPTTGTSPIHTQRMGNFGAFPTDQSLSFNFIHGTDLTGSTLGIHLLERVGGAPVRVVASNLVDVVPLPIAAPLTPPTPTPTTGAPPPTMTPEPPPTGDFAPGSGLLLGLMLAGFLLIAAGGTYIAQHRRSELS